MKTLVVKGAYGRIADKADWVKGKDFQMCSTGQYMSERDVPAIKGLGYSAIAFVDNNRQQLFYVRLDNA